MAASGGCLCGAVRYEVRGALSQPIACHCSQCARTSGNYAAMASCDTAKLELQPTDALVWYRSSSQVERGFCNICGGNLFWRAVTGEVTYVTAGTLDQPTGLKLSEHIFVGSKSDFYDIADGLPQKPEW